jgi:hypothetical protein
MITHVDARSVGPSGQAGRSSAEEAENVKSTEQAPAIVKVLRVVDTREVEEQGDRFVPIPGSGTENECARCGRLHEIHAHVLLADGTETVVGVSCAKAEALDIQRAIRTGAARATRLVKVRAQLDRDRAELARAVAVQDSTLAQFAPTFWIEKRERADPAAAKLHGSPLEFDVLHCGVDGDSYRARWLIHSIDCAELRAELLRDAQNEAIARALKAAGLRECWKLRDEIRYFERRLDVVGL